MSPSVNNADPPTGNGWGRTKKRNRDHDIFFELWGEASNGDEVEMVTPTKMEKTRRESGATGH